MELGNNNESKVVDLLREIRDDVRAAKQLSEQARQDYAKARQDAEQYRLEWRAANQRQMRTQKVVLVVAVALIVCVILYYH